MSDVVSLANTFKTLGQPERLAILDKLANAGTEGLPMAILQSELGLNRHTLAQHIAALVAANLVIQTRRGQTLYCQLESDNLELTGQFLEQHCTIKQQPKRVVKVYNTHWAGVRH